MEVKTCAFEQLPAITMAPWRMMGGLHRKRLLHCGVFGPRVVS